MSDDKQGSTSQCQLRLQFVPTPRKLSHPARANAAGLLWNLLLLDESQYGARMRAAELGAVPLLVYMLQYGDCEGQCNAAGALATMAFSSSELRGHIQECGGVPALLDILYHYEHTSSEKSMAANTLFHLCLNFDIRSEIGSDETIRELLLMIHNRDVSNPNNLSHIYAGKCLAVLASEPEVRQLLLEAGGVDVFSEWLIDARTEHRKLDAEVAGLCLYAMSLNESAAQRMKKGTLESLLSVFDVSSSGNRSSSSSP